ncbi:hypothetical protein CBM2586_A50441 [Cupriavidus phytorum]|uniref:Uncharacterized protein n=1 Tax=Cupriavidus taiwanensis TaxID=164546 RepID=A0A975X8I9_9BURK|nr:hypothetical protein CBM2586_A50441 [Cupriavidus taiwanensis]
MSPDFPKEEKSMISLAFAKDSKVLS